MQRIYPPIFLFTLALLFCTCGNKDREEDESGDAKADPYDMFAFQRSYPERDFDWKNWHKTMRRIRSSEAQSRGLFACGGNPTDWTLQGPANVAGRVNALAAKPGDDLTVLAGFAGGGIFKTVDGGLNWYPVFDDNPELAIGDIAYDPSNANIVYAGTGDPNIPGGVYNGDGVYKSTDGGESWQLLGLEQAGIVSKIMVDPQNGQNLYVATMGNPFVRDAERGVYKSTNGGASWQKVLFVSDQAGASDLAINPVNPQILYAAFWDRIRNNHESIVYGAHARIYKTTDGGANWNQLGGGLPTGVMGRVGFAMSAQNPDKLYAVYVDTFSNLGGIYKTTNGGTSWTAQSISALSTAYSDFGWYFGKLRLNPADDEELFLLGVLLWRRPPGSGAWQPGAGGHSDSHALLYTTSGRRYWGTDGGVYRSAPGQSSWTRCQNLPTTQLYHTDFNPFLPDTYFVGAQDNGIIKGNGAGLNNWTNVFFADGFNCAFHPDDPNTFWVETQNGAVHKTATNGDSWVQGDVAFETGDRCNWDAPFFMSNFNAPKRFGATYRVYSTVNDTWQSISGDLTDGPLPEARFHTISTLDESPVLAEKLYAGTSDGNVWVREPAGAWTNVTTGLPDRYVTSVHGSPTMTNRLFVTHSGYHDNEYIPHIHRSDDNGQNWVDISGNLPQMPVNDLFILPNQASDNVLFAATDAGVYFTLNSGQNWARLGGNVPVIPVFDLEMNPAHNQLMAATFARGLWTFPLDSIFNQPAAAMVNLDGVIQTETATGIGNVQLSTQPLNYTDANGLFAFPTPGCQSYVLAPYRNDNPLNGVSTYDLVLISKHILNIEPLNSPYKRIAADANRSGSITTTDIVAIRKLILGIDTVFTNNTSWRFVPADYVFPNPQIPFANLPESIDLQLETDPVNGLDFIGIKTGDLNGSVIAGASGAAEERATGQWPVSVVDRIIYPAETLDVVLSGDCSEIAGAQFTLQFDPVKLSFEKIEPLFEDLSTDNFGINRRAEGKVTVSFETNAAFSGTKALLRLVFKAKKGGRLSECLRVGEAPTPALAFDADGKARKPVLQFMPEQQTMQVWPNPFGEEGVWLQLPGDVASVGVLEVFDGAGRLVLRQAIAETTQPIHIAARVFLEKGTYFYRVKLANNNTPFSGKLIYLSGN